jgi:hypothetical protein
MMLARLLYAGIKAFSCRLEMVNLLLIVDDILTTLGEIEFFFVPGLEIFFCKFRIWFLIKFYDLNGIE